MLNPSADITDGFYFEVFVSAAFLLPQSQWTSGIITLPRCLACNRREKTEVACSIECGRICLMRSISDILLLSRGIV